MVETLWLVLGLIIDAVVEFSYWRWVLDPLPRRVEPHPVFVAVAIACVGAVAGAVATWLWPTRVFGAHGPVGLSLALVPLTNGVVMGAYGAWRQRRGAGHSSLATLWGGAAFGLGFAVVRFLLVEA